MIHGIHALIHAVLPEHIPPQPKRLITNVHAVKGERLMDPMLQLARRFLATEKTFEINALTDIVNEIEGEISKIEKEEAKTGANPNGCDGLHQMLWQSRDVRAQEILANVLYRQPKKIARRLCELKPELCPEFAHYLVDEANAEWESQKNGKWRSREKELHDLFERHGYDVHDNFPGELELCLVEKPEFMLALADHLNAALPFGLVLKKELFEIQKSRKSRLKDDGDARAAQWIKEIYRIYTILVRMPVDDHRGERYKNRLCALRRRILKRKSEAPNGDPQPVSTYAPSHAEKMSLFGLALSGGGIRSATFNLGVLQGLADLDLLRRVDYLSGVSGGSHIAGWLAAWIKREEDGIRRVQRWLSPVRCPAPDTYETQPIHFLRKFSNYLAPRKGLLSADTWSIFSAWLRNTVLNQIVFGLLLASLLGLPKLIFLVFDTGNWLQQNYGWTNGLYILTTVGLAVLIGLNLKRFDHDPRPGRGDRRQPSRLWEDFGIHSTIVLGFLVLGLLGSYQLWWTKKLGIITRPRFFWGATYLVIFLFLIVSQACARSWRSFYSQRAEDTTAWRTMGALLATAATSALSSFAGLGVLYLIFQHAISVVEKRGLAETLVLGPVVLIGVISLAIMLQIGFLGHNLPDTRREWWNRLGATMLITSTLWIAFSACALFGPWFVLYLSGLTHPAIPWSFLFFWLATTTIGFRSGQSDQTPPFPAEKEGGNTKYLAWITRTAPREWIARIAPYIYIAGLAILLSFMLYVLTFLPTWHFIPGLRPHSWYLNLFIPLGYWDFFPLSLGRWWVPPLLFVLAMFLAWRFDINEFSMHHFYRNRLVRCYLGASRTPGTRVPNPFTGFDPEDDLSLSELRENPPVPDNLARAGLKYHGPFPIINTTLNLVAGKELAWQERKAASFVFTPLYCGYECLPRQERTKRNFANYGYRPTTGYAEPRSNGPTLGTVLGISGAAVNPNMGYHSSPAVSFLMALFNVRLGCWLGNTSHKTSWKKSSPRLGLTYLINELTGNTDDTSWFINLSDGGHFENLGLYELVRRRCKYVIVSDAEEDSRFSFNGLGNAIRKCRTDFGVDIRLDPDQLRPVAGVGRSRTHCAVGEIIYSPDVRGILVYIKTSLTGDEPGDVLEYKLRQSVFPHQSTANQFFDESQFESYRALGQHTAMVILLRAAQSSSEFLEQPNPPPARPGNRNVLAENEILLRQMFRYLQAMWYPRPQSMIELSEQHSKLYADLLEKFRSNRGNELDGAARAFFRTPTHPQHEFFMYSMMIELMHRIFEDLELETKADHPHNEGWVSMFRDWAEDKGFKSVWDVVKGNYDIRFRIFCKREFALDPHESPQ
jgi:hypothetical protein